MNDEAIQTCEIWILKISIIRNLLALSLEFKTSHCKFILALKCSRWFQFSKVTVSNSNHQTVAWPCLVPSSDLSAPGKLIFARTENVLFFPSASSCYKIVFSRVRSIQALVFFCKTMNWTFCEGCITFWITAVLHASTASVSWNIRSLHINVLTCQSDWKKS